MVHTHGHCAPAFGEEIFDGAVEGGTFLHAGEAPGGRSRKAESGDPEQRRILAQALDSVWTMSWGMS